MRCTLRALLALLPLLAWAAAIDVEVRDLEVWLIRDGQALRLTHDGKAKMQAVLSATGDRIAYYEQCPQAEHCLPSVVVMDLAGRRLSSFQPKTARDDRCGSILSIAWTGEDAIATDCHINPSLDEYIETDLATGATRRDLLGYWFTPSPDGKRVAHVGWIVHFAPPSAQSNYLQVEHTTIYPLPRGSGPVEQKGLEDPPQVVVRHGVVSTGIHEFMPGFAWAADSQRVALVDCIFDWTDAEEGALSAAGGRESNRRCSLAVASVSGEAVLFRLDVPPDQLRQAKVDWIDSREVRLQAGDVTTSVRIP
jgi:hypothetical protein